MIRTFHLRDLLLVRRLQQKGTRLDLEEQLTQPISPLQSALLEKLFKPRANSSTFLLDQQNDNELAFGLAQLRARPGYLERDLVFVSPALDLGNGSYSIWQRLLNHVCVQTAEQGGMRVFARLPAEETPELKLFKSVGFSAYCQEDIYVLHPAQQPLRMNPKLSFRLQERGDEWRLQKLYALTAPRQVQNAERQAQGKWALPKQYWPEQGYRQGYVWEVDGELLGAVHLRIGYHGVWIRVLLHPDSLSKTEDFVQTILWLVRSQAHLPIYLAIRQYEAGWLSVLPNLNFKLLTTQILTVKHMTVQVRKTLPAIPVLQEAPAISGQSSMVGSQISVIKQTEEV